MSETKVSGPCSRMASILQSRVEAKRLSCHWGTWHHSANCRNELAKLQAASEGDPEAVGFKEGYVRMLDEPPGLFPAMAPGPDQPPKLSDVSPRKRDFLKWIYQWYGLRLDLANAGIQVLWALGLAQNVEHC